MNNPFGPQGSQATTSLPPGTNQTRYGDDPTWCKDCTAPNANDATVLDAAFFNNIIGNLNYAVEASGITPVARGDMSLLFKAIVKIVQGQIVTDGLVIDGGTF